MNIWKHVARDNDGHPKKFFVRSVSIAQNSGEVNLPRQESFFILEKVMMDSIWQRQSFIFQPTFGMPNHFM